MSAGDKKELDLAVKDTMRRCPRCAAFLRPAQTLLDPVKARTVRLFQCECGERIWDD
jgi:hypothetical protein